MSVWIWILLGFLGGWSFATAFYLWVANFKKSEPFNKRLFKQWDDANASSLERNITLETISQILSDISINMEVKK